MSIFGEPKISSEDNCGNVKIKKKEYNRLQKAARHWERYQSAFSGAIETRPQPVYGRKSKVPLIMFDAPYKNYITIDVNRLVGELLGTNVPTFVTLKLDEDIVAQKEINQ